MCNIKENEQNSEHMKQLSNEIEEIMSLEYIAKHLDMVDELDEEGYLPLERILVCPTIINLNTNTAEIIEAISKIPTLSLSEDHQHVRLTLPIERKTIILRDTPLETTEQDIMSLVGELDVSIRKELGSCWFITFTSEDIALQYLKELQKQTLHGQSIKARVKSEFYKLELLRRLKPYQTDEPPKRKLSSAATPFSFNPSGMWGMFGLNGVDFGYTPMNLPLVITSPGQKGYTSEYISYSRDQLYSIVRGMKDCSLPAIHTDVEILLKEPNCELVEKGRTLSIDQSLQREAPRTFSIDSVDYTNMVGGYMGDEVTAHLKKHRKQKKHN